jgi:type IVB pilus formation R64 PilN family outer membrane protein
MMVRKFCTVALLGILTACSTGAVREEVEQKTLRIDQDLERAKEPLPPLRSNPLTVTDRIWTGAKAVRMNRGLPLPTKLEGARSVSLASSEALSLSSVAEILSAQIGIPVRLGEGAPTGQQAPSADTPRRAPSNVSPAAAARAASPAASQPMSTESGDGMKIAYEGPLSGLLDQVAANFGVNWSYDGTTIAFSKFETRVFMLEVMPGKGKFSDKISDSGGGSSGGSGGGSSGGSSGAASDSSLKQETTLEAELDAWTEITNTVNAILGGTGSSVASPTVGSITVTTTPDVMKNVARYISDQNQRLSRQIAINVDVYTADISNEDNINNQLTAALKTIKPFSFTGVAAPAFATSQSNFSNLSIGLIDNANVSADSILTAISKISTNVRVAKFPITTLNNVPVTRRVGRDIAFLASAATTTTGTSGTTTTTLTPGTLREGFSIQLAPRLLSDGRILLQYSLNLVDVIRISSFTSGQSTVQLPETSSRVFVQQSLLRSGSTLILAGYSQDQTRQNANGLLDPYNILTGGGIGNDKSRSLLLIAITPQELDVPPLEQP